MLSRFSRVRLCATPWAVACQAPLSMGFFRQEYWSELPCPPPEDLPYPGIKLVSLMSPVSAGRFFSSRATLEAHKFFPLDFKSLNFGSFTSLIWILQSLTTTVLFLCFCMSSRFYFPGEGNGNLLQYSCLENSKDRGAWWESMGLQRVGHD